MAHCKSCGAPIVWATTPRGAAMPVDAAQDESGNIALTPNGIAVVISKSLSLDGVEHTRHQSHWSTCPNAKQHKKGGTR